MVGLVSNDVSQAFVETVAARGCVNAMQPEASAMCSYGARSFPSSSLEDEHEHLRYRNIFRTIHFFTNCIGARTFAVLTHTTLPIQSIKREELIFKSIYKIISDLYGM